MTTNLLSNLNYLKINIPMIKKVYDRLCSHCKNYEDEALSFLLLDLYDEIGLLETDIKTEEIKEDPKKYYQLLYLIILKDETLSSNNKIEFSKILI